MSIFNTPIENAPGIAYSEISSLKMLFNGDSADSISNVLTDVIGGLTITAANSIVFSKGTHGYVASGATGTMNTLAGTLPAFGTKNFVQFGRWPVNTQGAGVGQFDIGNYYNTGGWDQAGTVLHAGSAIGAYDGTGWLGHSGTNVKATYASAPIWIAILSNPTTTSTFIVCTAEGSDVAPDDSGGPAGSELNDGVGPANNELFLPQMDTGALEGGPMGLLVLDGAVPNLELIQRGLAWFTNNPGTLMPPMWKGLV